MICKECGAYNPDHASFCKVCAASLKDAPVYEEPETEIPEGPSQDDFARPSRTFAKPPAWKPTSNFNFEPRPRASSNLFDEDEGEQDAAETEDVSFRPQRVRPAAPVYEEQEEDADDEPVPVRRAAAPVKRSYLEQEADDEESEDEDEDVFVRRKPVAKPVKRVYVEEDDADDEDEEDEDDAPIVRRKPVAKQPAKPVKRSYAEEDDEDDEDEDEDDAPIVRKKPVAKQPAKPVKRSYAEEDDEDDEDEDEDYRPMKKAAKKARRPVEYDEDDDEEYDDDEDDDGYTPRRQKSPSSSIFTILLVVLLVLVLAVVAIFVLANNVPSMGEKLPMLVIKSCSNPDPVSADQPADGLTQNPGDTPADSPDVSSPTAYVEDSVNVDGVECVKFCVRVDAGETLTIDLPNQDDYTITNTEASAIDYKIEVPKQAFNPNTPLETAVYEASPAVTLTDAAGVTETLTLPFTINFPTISLAVNAPVYSGEPVMAAEGNVITIEGKVDAHTVTVSANGQPLSVYEDGYFKGDYTMQGEADETVVITATQDNCVTASTEIVVTPYVFVAQEMSVAITKGVAPLRASESNSKVSVKGLAEPGATLVATSDNENVLCGAVSQDVSGNFLVDVTFNENYYGIANVTVSAVKEGYIDASDVCIVTRMYEERGGMTKNKNYYEIPKHKSAADLVANPTQAGYFRITIRLDEVSTVDGYTICKVSILQSGKDPVPAYVMNQSVEWDPNENRVGNEYNIYAMLNGLYPETENLYLIAFFAVAR